MQSQRKFNPSTYLELSQDHLVVASLWLLLDNGKLASFENMVAEAFLSFPERFQLEGYPDWPNANIVAKSWVRCRTDKKWITGSASSGFSLTPLGEQIAIRTLDALGTKTEANRQRRGSRQSISSRVVLHVENSKAFKVYKTSGISGVTEFDFCDLLYCTLGTTPEVLTRNLEVVKQEVTAYGRNDLKQFLDALADSNKDKLTGKRARGGLMPQKQENVK